MESVQENNKHLLSTKHPPSYKHPTLSCLSNF